MNKIIKAYFDRLSEVSMHSKLFYNVYERDEKSSMPYSVHIKLPISKDLQFNTWGSGANKDVAFGKAIMEMIERVSFSSYSPIYFKPLFKFSLKKKSIHDISKKFNIDPIHIHPSNTNGVAIHLSKKNAKKAALLELIERHVILYTHVKNISPHGHVEKHISDKECKFYYWKGPLSTYTVIGRYPIGEGSYYSSGCDYDLNLALEKAELELNSFLFLESKKNIAESDYSIKFDDIDSFNRYHRYSGDNGVVDFLNKTSTQHLPELNKDDFYFCLIPQPILFKGLPDLPVVRVIHPNVQQLFFDNWALCYLNPRIFDGQTTLPTTPHIIA